MLRLFLFTIGLKYNKCTFYWKCRIQASIILASIFVLYKLHLKPTSFSVTKTVFCSMYSSPRSPSWKTTSVSLTTVVLVREMTMTSRSMLGLGQEVQCPPLHQDPQQNFLAQVSLTHPVSRIRLTAIWTLPEICVILYFSNHNLVTAWSPIV